MEPDPNLPSIDRRPIAARRLGVMHALARWLAARRVHPNAISVAGMVGACVAGALLSCAGRRTPWGEAVAWAEGGWAERVAYLAAAGLIQLRLLANLIDGMVAVEGGMRSPVGELYNEVPDRVSDVFVLAGAGYVGAAGAAGAGDAGGCPWLGWLCACLAVFVAYVRSVGKGAGFPNDWRGPMAKQQRMAVITAACCYLGLAPVGWRVSLELGDGQAAGVMTVALVVIAVGSLVTAWRRLARLAADLTKRGLS